MFAWLKQSYWRKPPVKIKDPESWAPWFTEVEQRRRYTPDLPELERLQWHYLFVPDEMQVGHWQHHLLNGCVKLEEEGFTQDRLMMLKHDLGIFSRSLIFKDQLNYKNPPPLLPIKGELYRVPPAVFIEVDRDKQNTVFCFRQQVSVAIPYTHIWAKDRSIFDKIFGKTLVRGVTLPEQEGKKAVRGGSPRQSSYIERAGIRRVRVWVYFADPNYWEDFLNLTTTHPPVRTYDNPDGLVKRYYRFTDAEYGPNKDKPPWK